ncbi:MAG: carbon-nitrogen hydrolase family protein [Cyanobacteria bacterium J06626_14]
MKPKPFKLALLQMQVKGGDRQWNICHAVELIAEAASKGAEVVLLPECMDLGWIHPSSLKMADNIPGGKACKTLTQTAKQNEVYICAGLTEKSGEKIFNSAVIIDKHGNILCKHRKLNELEIGHDYYDQGNRLNVVKTEYGVFGLMICADALAKDNVLSRSLGYMGADIILSPSSWAVSSNYDNVKTPYGDIWRHAYMPVAKEFSTAIFGVSNVGRIVDGPWKGMKCIGCSLGLDASGQEILQGPYGIDAECILYVDIKPNLRTASDLRNCV